MPDLKLQEFISKQMDKWAQEKLGTAAYANLAPTGQPALEGQVVKGDDVRVLETMRNSVYDEAKDGVVDNTEKLGGSTKADVENAAVETAIDAMAIDFRNVFLFSGI